MRQAELTTVQQRTLRESNERATELKKQIPLCQQKRGELESAKAELETRLRDNLTKRRGEIIEELADTSAGGQPGSQGGGTDGSGESLERLQTELSVVLEKAAQLEGRQMDVEEELAAFEEKVGKLRADITKMKKDESERESQLSEAQQKMEQLLSKRATLLSKKDTAMRKIRELGSLPSLAMCRSVREVHRLEQPAAAEAPQEDTCEARALCTCEQKGARSVR
eukprot:SAG11_NODE_2363_length_3459_cov_1.931548_2_plen_224_part_00